MHCCGGRLGLPRSILHFLEIKSFPNMIAVTRIISPQTENIKFRLVTKHMCNKVQAGYKTHELEDVNFRLVTKHMCDKVHAGYKTHV